MPTHPSMIVPPLGSRTARGVTGVARVAAVVAVALIASACSSTEVKTVAILRAVPGSSTGADAMIGTLRSAGWVPPATLRILAEDPSEAYTTEEDVRAAVADWLDKDVDLIFAQSSLGARIAKEVAPTTPIVFLVNDPVALGLVENENAPEGNMTGVTFRVPADRTLSLASRALGDDAHIGFLYPADDPAAAPHREAVSDAARSLGLRLTEVAFKTDPGIGGPVKKLARAEVDAILVANAPTAAREVAAIEEAALALGIPTILNADLGTQSLITFSPNTEELLRQMGRQAARIFAGASIDTIPVEDPRSYLLTIDEGTAMTLGITLPEGLYREADTIIRP